MPEPVRTCVVCRVKSAKNELVRFVWGKNKPEYDASQNRPGRGAYCCNTEKCRDRFLSMERKWRKIFKI